MTVVIAVFALGACTGEDQMDRTQTKLSDDQQIVRTIGVFVRDVRDGTPVLAPYFEDFPGNAPGAGLLSRDEAIDRAHEFGVTDQMISLMEQRSKSSKFIEPAPNLEELYYLPNMEALGEAFNEYPADMWQGIRTDFPDSSGVVFLAAPGYNEDRNLAVVHAGLKWASPLQQYNWFFVLEKRSSGWSIRKAIMTQEPWKG